MGRILLCGLSLHNELFLCCLTSPQLAFALWKTLDQRPQVYGFYSCALSTSPDNFPSQDSSKVTGEPLLTWAHSPEGLKMPVCVHRTCRPICLFQNDSSQQVALETLKAKPHLSTFISSLEAPCFHPRTSGSKKRFKSASSHTLLGQKGSSSREGRNKC
jgi:hypothetical protein